MKNRSYSLKQAATLGLFLLIIFIAGLLMFSNLTNGVIWYWGGDFAQYIMQAKSILDGSTQNFVEANRIAIEQTSVNLALFTFELLVQLARALCPAESSELVRILDRVIHPQLLELKIEQQMPSSAGN